MKIKILGSGHEVGKSAISVDDGNKNILLDCGVKIQPEPPTYPSLKQKIDACIISHAHLDHCGATPMLFTKKKVPCYMNDVTLAISDCAKQ